MCKECFELNKCCLIFRGQVVVCLFGHLNYHVSAVYNLFVTLCIGAAHSGDVAICSLLIYLLLCKNFGKYITHSVCLFAGLFVCLQHNSKTNEWMVMKFLWSIRTVTRKN